MREIRHALEMGNLSDLILNPPQVRSGYQCVTGGAACPGHISKHMLCDPPIATGGVFTRAGATLVQLGDGNTEFVFPADRVAKVIDDYLADIYAAKAAEPPPPPLTVDDIRRTIERLGLRNQEPSEYVEVGLWLTADELDRVKAEFGCDRPVEPRFLTGLDQLLGIRLYQAGCEGCSNAPGRPPAVCLGCTESCGSPRCIPSDRDDAAQTRAVAVGYIANGAAPTEATDLAKRCALMARTTVEFPEALAFQYAEQPRAQVLVNALHALAEFRRTHPYTP